MAYEIKDNNVFRDGEKVAEFAKDGTVTMMEGHEDYRLPATKAVRDFLDDWADGDKNDETKPDVTKNDPLPPSVEKLKPIQTVTELVAAMQKYTEDKCPAFSNFYGDKTPEVQNWIKKHDEIRLTVLRAHSKGE